MEINTAVGIAASAKSSLAELSNYPHRKRIALSGTGKDETDYIVKLNLHWGRQHGDITDSDIFMNEMCKTDFSDVRFTDSDGNPLEHYQHAVGNCEVILDNVRVGSHNIVHDGVIYARGPEGIIRSYDNGYSWELLYSGMSYTLYPLLVDSRKNIFITDNYTVKRSIDNGATFETVLDMTSVSGHIQYTSFVEDKDGNLYAGQYQSQFDATIHKSVDGGETWTVLWNDNTYQHIHGLFIDPYTDYFYAGVDSSQGTLIRSTDGGITWTPIYTAPNGDAPQMVFTPTRRFFAGGATFTNGNNTSVLMTTDDVTFTPVLQTGQSVQGMAILGNHIYVAGTSYNPSGYSQIYQMDLDGTNAKTVRIETLDAEGSFDGYRNFFSSYMPIGATEPQILFSGGESPSFTYSNGRIFGGGLHYQTIFYVKMDLPANGGEIIIQSGNPSAISTSTKSIFKDIAQPNLIARWKLDEGEGTIVNDSSGNGRHGTITHISGKGGWNNFTGRRAGSAYPFIVKDGASYNFNSGDYIEIPNDAVLDALVKGFSVVAWVKGVEGSQKIVIGKGDGNNGWSLQTRGASGYPVLNYGNGTANTYIYGNSPTSSSYNWSCRDVWHMIGFTLDDSTPAKMRSIWDGKLSLPKELSYDIVGGTGLPVRIGASSSGLLPYLGDVCDVQIYDSTLTALQVQQLYEDRFLAAVEPKIIY